MRVAPLERPARPPGSHSRRPKKSLCCTRLTICVELVVSPLRYLRSRPRAVAAESRSHSGAGLCVGVHRSVRSSSSSLRAVHEGLLAGRGGYGEGSLGRSGGEPAPSDPGSTRRRTDSAPPAATSFPAKAPGSSPPWRGPRSRHRAGRCPGSATRLILSVR